ncbi:MAG: repeat-containing protein [Chthonomonadales bacterium]|nr:repeat-containing protein [Chthonomonadales bacterium]
MLTKTSLVALLTTMIACFMLVPCSPQARAQAAQSALLKPGLEDMKKQSATARVRGVRYLGKLGPKAAAAVPALVEALKDPMPDVQFGAADALSRIGTPALPALMAAIKNSNAQVRTYALLALMNMPPLPDTMIPSLIEVLRDENAGVRANAAFVLGAMGVPAAGKMPELIVALKDPVRSVSMAALTNIQSIAATIVLQRKSLSGSVLQKTLTDLQSARQSIEDVVHVSDPQKETMEGIASELVTAQCKLLAEFKRRPSPSPGETSGAEQGARPARHDTAEARQWIAQAEQIVATISEEDLRVWALEDVAIVRAQTGDYEGARAIARTLKSEEAKARILLAMAIQMLYDGEYEEGVKIIDGIGSPQAKVRAYLDIIDTLTDLKQKMVALEVVIKAREVKLPANVSENYYFILVGRALARAGKPEITSAWASSIKSRDFEANVTRPALFAIAKAYNHDLAGAQAKYAELHFAPMQITVLESIVEVQLRSGDRRGAAATGKQIIEIVQTIAVSPMRVLMNLARLQHANGDPAEAQATFRTAIDIALKHQDEVGLGQIAATQADTGDVDGALKTMGQMKEALNQMPVRKAIASFRAKSGDVRSAREMSQADADALCRAEVLMGIAQGILESLQPFLKR